MHHGTSGASPAPAARRAGVACVAGAAQGDQRSSPLARARADRTGATLNAARLHEATLLWALLKTPFARRPLSPGRSPLGLPRWGPPHGGRASGPARVEDTSGAGWAHQ